MTNYKLLTTCPISHTKKHITYLDFGMMPLANDLGNTRQEALNCQRFPVALNYYPASRLSMLTAAVDPQRMFTNYVYQSGINQPYVEHCKQMYDDLSKLVDIKSGDCFLDIGGNDGTLLSAFREKAKVIINPLNIDAAENLAKLSARKGILALAARWGCKTASHCNLKFKVITSTNVVQHTEDIQDFVRAIHRSLLDDGIWCLEFPYWKNCLETTQYDQTYSEHIYYLTLTPLYELFKQNGLHILEVSRQNIQGGSLRIISQKGKSLWPCASAAEFLDEESSLDEKFYRAWPARVKSHLARSKATLRDLKESGHRIAAFGAAAKGCVFLNAAGIDHGTIDYIVDDTPSKQNRFMPGVGIEIVPRQRLVANPPDYVLILAHNFGDYIAQSVRPIFGGKFIKMFPEPIIFE